ncbi:luciferase family protein [Streptomyces sp. NPDC006703]|uniref:luciferase domain-containing protein n=1 Tax=Streptomyces sp. NPDC006703 TaxID=3364759 RepID=UPI0036CAF138
MTLAARALAQLVTWPDLSEAEPSCGNGRALRSAHGEIAHFHSDRDVDLHLTVKTIRKFEDHLAASRGVRMLPGSQWVTVRLENPTDIDLLMTLVSLALQVHQAWPAPGDALTPECNDHQSAPRSRDNFRHFGISRD